MLLVLEISPGIYLATLRDAAGAVVCRFTGPANWVLLRLAEAMDAKKPATGRTGAGCWGGLGDPDVGGRFSGSGA